MSSGQFISFDKRDRIGVVTLTRADALNAISGELARQLAETMEDIAADRDIWAVVLRAQGEKAFCVGADLKERSSFTTDDYYANRADMRRMFDSIRNLPQPSVAAIFGFALGGGLELALSCDLIVAAAGTKIGLPEARVGLLPAGGGTQLLARRTGLARAKDIIFTGRRVDAAEALEIGVVARVVERERLDEAAFDLASEITKASPVAAREAKRVIDHAFVYAPDDAMEIENEAWKTVVVSDDRAEGIAAFNEKRMPQWKNE